MNWSATSISKTFIAGVDAIPDPSSGKRSNHGKTVEQGADRGDKRGRQVGSSDRRLLPTG